MRIDSATIGMESARSYQALGATVRRFTVKDYQQSLANNNSLNAAVQGENEEEDEKNTENAQNTEQAATLEEWYQRMNVSSGKVSIRSSRETVFTNIQQITIRYIFDLLFSSRKERLNRWSEDRSWLDNSMEGEMEARDMLSGQTESGKAGTSNWLQTDGSFITTNFKMLNYSEEGFQMEKEDTTFSTVGKVRTADGREISFNVNVGMSREFQQYYQKDLELANFKMCDPLVINLDTDVAQLSDQNFYFDIDADGEKDEIAQLAGGSGYLALDKNGDNTINDGNELFGTKSGNGFADLAQYDQDGNGWIDEGDAIWSKLKIWCKNEKGEDVLYHLADKGVGAICLQNAETDFTLKGESGRTKGQIRNTGIFLYENGNVGTIQHVDVAKYQSQA
ncbi:MAG: hypothetical protein J6A94_05870 [Lachnospiraceae bacterium]|nr:hypothetical protein [Lachnospiraceae bacterium]